MLYWSESNRFSGVQVTAAACVFTLMTVIYVIDWIEGIHVAGTANTRADMISRKKPWTENVTAFPELLRVNRWQEDDNTRRLVALCNPRRVWASDEEFASDWKAITQLLRS